VRLSLCSWSLPELTLPEVRDVVRALGLDGYDVGLFYAAALDKQLILSDPRRAAEQLRALGLPSPSYYHLLGDDLADRNLARAGDHARNLEDLRAVVTFCAAAEIPTLFLLPGVVNPGQTRAQALEVAARGLRAATELAGEQGVTLTIEPHVHSLAESPATTLELLERVPGLKLALDYSHFVCLGHTQEAIDVLLPHAAHVHLRQARSGRLQERLGYGTINFAAIVGGLRDLGYDGWLALEPLHQDYIDCWNVDVVTEVVQLRELVRRLTA
jgi:sugar phosphate isomerase/epimerase